MTASADRPVKTICAELAEALLARLMLGDLARRRRNGVRQREGDA